jgi:acetolactate synthase-1/2/3 large subunit
MKMTGAQMIVESLIKQKVPYVFFGPPGPCAFLDAFYDHQEKIKPILIRHEQVGANMADGWFKGSHQPGVFCVHGGPGLQNTVIGLATSLVHSSAVIAIAGITSTQWWGKGGHQELGVKEDADSSSICKPIVKQTWGIVRADRIPEIMHRAFNVATTGKPGPVLLSVPVDMFNQAADVEISDPPHHKPQRLPMGDPSSLERMAEILTAAERPVLIAGGGAIISECGPELQKLAEKLSIPVATSYSGKGAFPEDHILSISAVGAWGTRCANRLISEADTVLALGTRLNQSIANGWSYGDPFAIPPTQLLQIDINPHEIGRNLPVEVGAVGDLKSSLQYILQLLEQKGVKPRAGSSWAKKAAAYREEWNKELFPRFQSPQKPIQPERAIKELRDLMPKDAIVLADAGNNRGHICNLWTTYAPQTLFMDSGNVAMGYGPSAALGVQLARPDKLVVSISGDGGFTQVNTVLATAVEYSIPVKWVVLNDQALGHIVFLQKEYHGSRVLCTRFEKVADHSTYDLHFPTLAKAYHVPSERVENPSDLRDAIVRMIKTDGPYLLDIVIDPESKIYYELPYHFPKAKPKS